LEDQAREGPPEPLSQPSPAGGGLVLEHGDTVNQAVAGLLHDAVEDCSDVTVRQLRETFGARVAAIVADCTDATHADKRRRSLSWKERKLRYLAHLADSSDASVLVVACDKRQNLGALVGDVRVHGVGYLRRFNSTPQQQVWYYASVLRAIGRRIPARLRAEMEIALADFRRLCGDDAGAAAVSCLTDGEASRTIVRCGERLKRSSSEGPWLLRSP
jgi:hypothetical protein